MTLMYELDLKFVGQAFQVAVQTGQTDTQIDASKCITKPHSQVIMRELEKKSSVPQMRKRFFFTFFVVHENTFLTFNTIS